MTDLNGGDPTIPVVMETPEPIAPKPRENPLLSRRMVNAYARISGCTEPNPDTVCDHRILARRSMEMLIEYFKNEKP